MSCRFFTLFHSCQIWILIFKNWYYFEFGSYRDINLSAALHSYLVATFIDNRTPLFAMLSVNVTCALSNNPSFKAELHLGLIQLYVYVSEWTYIGNSGAKICTADNKDGKRFLHVIILVCIICQRYKAPVAVEYEPYSKWKDFD